MRAEGQEGRDRVHALTGGADAATAGPAEEQVRSQSPLPAAASSNDLPTAARRSPLSTLACLAERALKSKY